MVKSFGYCLTINNPKGAYTTDAGLKMPAESNFVSTLDMHDLLVTKHVIHYIIGDEGGWSKEAARKNNFRMSKGYKPLTPHLQCAIYFKEKKSFKEVKAIFPRAHIERLRMPYTAAWFYCRKEGIFDERGDLKEAMNHDNAQRLSDPDQRPIGYDTMKDFNPLEPVLDNLGAIAMLHYGDPKVGSTRKMGEGGSATGAGSSEASDGNHLPDPEPPP